MKKQSISSFSIKTGLENCNNYEDSGLISNPVLESELEEIHPSRVR
jgi:hypothetical protein